MSAMEEKARRLRKVVYIHVAHKQLGGKCVEPLVKDHAYGPLALILPEQKTCRV